MDPRPELREVKPRSARNDVQKIQMCFILILNHYIMMPEYIGKTIYLNVTESKSQHYDMQKKAFSFNHSNMTPENSETKTCT